MKKKAIMESSNGYSIVSRIVGDPSISNGKYHCGWDNDWSDNWDEGPWDKESWSDDWSDSHR